jgi:hypothetical protein
MVELELLEPQILAVEAVLATVMPTHLYLALEDQELLFFVILVLNVVLAVPLFLQAVILIIHLHLQEHTQHESFCKSTRRQSHTSHCGRA